MKMTFNYLNTSNKKISGEAISALRLAITEKGHTLKTDCQVLLVATVEHMLKFGSGLGAQGELKQAFNIIKTALGNSQEQAAVQWVHECVGGLYWNDKEKCYYKDRKIADANPELFALKAEVKGVKIGKTEVYSGSPLELPFWLLQKPIEPKPFEFEKAMTSFIGKVASNENIPIAAKDILENALAEVKKLIAEHKADLARIEGEKVKEIIADSEKRETEKQEIAKPEPVKAERPKAERKIKSLAELAA